MAEYLRAGIRNISLTFPRFFKLARKKTCFKPFAQTLLHGRGVCSGFKCERTGNIKLQDGEVVIETLELEKTVKDSLIIGAEINGGTFDRNTDIEDDA